MTQRKTTQLLLSATAALPALTAAQAQQPQRPNIMLIVVDDMGYSDLECFGGEVHSPNLNGLAENGIRFTQFFNSGRSCPSRAQLLTGRYAQTVGITGMGQSLTKDCVTIPEVLRQAGYHTAMSGKWHLSLTQGIGNNADQMAWLSHQNTFNNRPFAPIDTYPCNRGFEEHWGTIWGVTDHFDPFSLVHNEEPIFTDSIPSDFYYADYVADKAIDMMDVMTSDGKPFFMYVAFQEPHWPVQAKPQDIAKYKGVYDDGWDVLREHRYQRLVELGIVDPEETPVAANASGRSWENETDKAFQSANMEVHAAMVDCVDQNIGRIIDEMKRLNIFDNTLIIFCSDNGASSENYTIGDFDRHDRTRSGQRVVHNAPTPGGQLTYNYLHNGWAGAVNTPFRYWKTTQFHGGTATPAIIHWPAGISHDKEGTINREPCHFLDIMPTCIELAGAEYPTSYNGHAIKPLCDEGRSILPLLQGEGVWQGERVLFWEHEGGRAVRKGDWRLTALSGAGWQLFNLKTDYSETNNVAAEYPDKVRELKTLWNQWAKSVGLSVQDDIEDTPKELIFHYDCDNNMEDRSSNKYALTPSARGFGYDEGVYGKAITLDGNAQYLDLNTTGILDTKTTQTTFCAWVYNQTAEAPTASNSQEGGYYFRDQVILAQKDNAGTGRIYLYGRAEAPTGGGDARFFYNNFIGAQQNRASYGSLVPGQWQHVAVVCNPVDRSITYYINGTRDCTVSAQAFEACTGGFRIGGHKASKDYFVGKLDELYFFKGILSADEIRQVMDNTIDLSAYNGGDTPVDDPQPTSDWMLDGKCYTIRNFSSTPAYMQDLAEPGDGDDYIRCVGEVNDNAYWTFEKTANKDCYYVKNVTTSRYIQAYAPTTEQPVLMGDDKVEYYVVAPSAEGGRYGFAYTGNAPFDFTSGTIGLNLKAESNQADCWVQTFAAVNGTNHRSFWTLDEVEDLPTGITEVTNRHSVTPHSFDLQGRRITNGRLQKGVYIVNGKKVLR
ncbi:MAG: sulfatase-like hydrolase/transferase [Prevotella sp.]|nr:sulfatase-like hydrolase/transferase [Prevotella sp.]